MPIEEVRMLYASAVGYADAAQVVMSSSEYPARTNLIPPAQTLIALSIELCLKAVFLHNGGDEKVLKLPSIRHNLVELRRINREAGYTSQVESIDQIIDYLGENYAGHDYRYMKPDYTLKYVYGDGAYSAVQELVDEVALKVGLPQRPDAPSVAT